MSQNARKAAPAKPVYRNLTPDILQYIDCVEKTLDVVFKVPADRRKQIVTSFRTLYRHADPKGQLRLDGKKLLHARKRSMPAGVPTSLPQPATAVAP